MLYYKNLEEILFNRHEIVSEEPDEFVIISGYIGPYPIERLSELPMKTTVIGGMYSGGINARLLNSLNTSKSKNKNLSILFSKEEIHSKIYIWKKDGKILNALIGSANFSSNGLRTDYRESLADATRDTYAPLEEYYQYIISGSSEEPILSNKQLVIDFSKTPLALEKPKVEIKYTYDIPLFSHSQKEGEYVNTESGLNWGLARFNGSHVAPGDAYIRLPKDILKDNQGLLEPFDREFETPQGKRKRSSAPIEVIWDDGTIMPASLEGIQKYKGLNYPKQLASYSSRTPYLDGQRISKKSILGRYLRKRLGIELDDLITIQTLEKYGRKTITLSLIETGVYYADFSV